MLQEVRNIQQRAVTELCAVIKKNKEITFKAPTGSGKTRMMADFMNRVLSQRNDVVFLVSSLSKGNLAEQNYNAFRTCEMEGGYPFLNSYLINSEIADEEGVFIPLNYNVYVLPRDLYKERSRLYGGAFKNFLESLTNGDLTQAGQGKQIYVIKDECHQATNNLDSLSAYFAKVINFSATPKLSRGQNPDVIISEEEAVEAKLIKKVETGSDTDTVEDAINKFIQIKKDYRNLLEVNPCLIIQISNGLDAEKEWSQTIFPALNKHQELKWMMIVDKDKDCDTNDDVKKSLPVARWKDYAKDALSTIDIIVFKMVISEGWDIPRACMLYQVRDTQSKVLDEQVMGRVRRNPRLLDFENLSEKAQRLATTAWIWGVKDSANQKTYTVTLQGGGEAIQQDFRLKTTRLKPLVNKIDFNIEDFLAQQKPKIQSPSIFDLYQGLKKQENELIDLCYSYTQSNYNNWFLFTKNIDDINKVYGTYKCNYDESMQITCDEDGKEIEVTFPKTSYVTDNGTHAGITDWIWLRKDEQIIIPFDSVAEIEWANFLMKISKKRAKSISIQKTDIPELFDDEEQVYLWGKNFLVNSEIKFEYYSNGLHFSYPDFILKDKNNGIHIMEVKSLMGNGDATFDIELYREKINKLADCYKACSKLLPDYTFYIPIYENRDWTIHRYKNGTDDIITLQQFINSL